MLNVLDCIVLFHDLRLVTLAALLCLFASATAMSILARACVASGSMAQAWIAAAGFVSGCGIWATHFISMQAFSSGFPLAYEIWWTIASVIVAIVFCTCGFAVAFMPRKKYISTPVAGGAIIGLAISGMHYMGMAAVRAPATMHWDAITVSMSVLIGTAMMAFALWVALRKGLRPAFIFGTVLFTLAICAMHFTGMSAVTFKYDPTVVVPGTVVSPAMLAIAVAACAALIVTLGLVGVMIDRYLDQRNRSEALILRKYVAELEAAKKQQEATSRKLRLALATAAAASQAKSDFLASMSHELRTPLNAVIGFSELMASETFGPLGTSRYKEYAGDIHDSGKHLLAMINDILDLSRLDAGALTLNEDIFPPSAIVDPALRMVANQARKKNLALVQDVPSHLPNMLADERRIKQVVINLLTNAVKFTPEGGRITLRAWSDAAGLYISVSDTGIGIAPDMIDKALEPFGQIDAMLSREHGGAGLGLPLSKQLMEAHGGSLVLESVLNAGTTVTVSLPASRMRENTARTAA